jgi:peroxiredoxin
MPKPSSAPAPKPGGLLPIAYLGFVAAAGMLVYSFVSVAREGEARRRCAPMCLLRPEYAATSKKVPDFTLKNLRGESVSMASYRGKVVVLNFWTKTCGPCLEEMPSLASLAHILKDRPDVELVTVSVDPTAEEAKETLRAILTEEPPFEVLMDTENDVVSKKFGTHLFPETWIIDKRGVIRARFDSKRPWAGSAVVELIDQIRSGGFCPLEIHDGRTSGEGAKVCEDLSGS